MWRGGAERERSECGEGEQRGRGVSGEMVGGKREGKMLKREIMKLR